MIMMNWGLLGPEELSSQRRTRTLDLGAVVRLFNERAVPGMGGVWFGKQLLLATLGVAVAQGARERGHTFSNIEVANAIEALACWLAFYSNGWQPEWRLRGSSKMPRDVELSFSRLKSRNFYVSQPMRMATVEPLSALGLVEANAARFNAFRCTPVGKDFIEVATGSYRPHRRNAREVLVDWVCGSSRNINTDEMIRALSPLEALPAAAREYLHHLLVAGDEPAARRRRAALIWVEKLRGEPQSANWDVKPQYIEEKHWRDLHSGALFFQARDAAISVLDQIEACVGSSTDQRLHLDSPLLGEVSSRIEELRQQAQIFLDAKHDPTGGSEASRFCRECVAGDDAEVVRHLLARDGRVLRLLGSVVLPGAAFRGTAAPNEVASNPDDEGAEVDLQGDVPLPKAISYRMQNLFWLYLDLRDELGAWLSRESTGA